MNSIAVPCSRLMRRNCRSTFAWTVTSSAVVGSSAMSSRGFVVIAEAIEARWSMPPLSSCGCWRSRRSGSVTWMSARARTMSRAAWRRDVP